MSRMDGSLLRGFDRIENVCREIEFDTKEKITAPFSISDTQIKTVNNSYLRTEQSEKYLPQNKTSVSVSNDQLAKVLMENNIFLNVNNSLYHWVNQKGHYVGMTTEYADKFVRQEIPEKYRYKINSWKSAVYFCSLTPFGSQIRGFSPKSRSISYVTGTNPIFDQKSLDFTRGLVLIGN